MSETKVFVTGASGLVGFHLIQFLLRRNYSVVGLVRNSSKREDLLRIGSTSPNKFEIVSAELGNQARLAELMSGADVVVHTAASIEPNGKRQTLDAINVGGTRSALNAAITAGVKHFIHISSLSVITGEEDRYGVTEEEALKYCRESYANSKIDAEKLVMKQRLGNRIAVTALRPGFIYGPNERTWMPRLIKAIKSGSAVLVGDGHKETNVIYVGNLLRAIELAMLNPTAYGEIYNLTDGEIVTKKDLFDAVCDGLGLPHIRRRISTATARLLVEAATLIAPIAPGFLKERCSQYSRASFRLVALNQGFDISKAERELNYVERIPFAKAMSETLSQWKQAPS
ncbi:MAG: hypothetical protein C5B53_05820 [Candidatus Melainabacteria bacterium]|nr:MAG: hypothetical protein C5B53_05820 [Candidatus Melainabacteria bacterium]